MKWAEETGAGQAERIVTLDILRGIAVMGILAINILGFALPSEAQGNPYALGQPTPADLGSWLFSFVFVEGKMRGLFSVLFGASMLLVIDRAEAAGRSGTRIHLLRMIWLLPFGLLHHYFIWSGDILILYAAVGLLALAFTQADVRALIVVALLLLVGQLLYFGSMALGVAALAAEAAAPGASAGALSLWEQVQYDLPPFSPAEAQAVVDLHRGPYETYLAHVFTEKLWDPLIEIENYGMETLALFLLGMAGLRTGFLTGAWSARAYRRTMMIGFSIGIPLHLLLAFALMETGFAEPAVLLFDYSATIPLRPLMIAATVALIILATRRGGRLTARIAAAGRAALTNYLGMSVVMTFIFFGWGLGWFGAFGRASLWVFVILGCVLILAWSKPWLERYRYGPCEWAWRSLARGRWETLRRA